MKKILITTICFLLILQNIVLAKKRLLLDKEVNIIVTELASKIKKDSNLVITDFQDLDGRITYFGRYLASKIETELATKPGISIVNRTELEKVMQEIKLQSTGVFDNTTIVKMGKMVGANTIIYGTVTELKDSIDINLKIMNVEKGVVISGVTHTIEKTREIASLVGSIILSEKEKEKDLEIQRQKILSDIEVEKQKRLKAIENEENEMRKNVVELEKKLRSESEIIKKYEAKKSELEQKQRYIEKLKDEIDNTNFTAEQNVRLGMTYEQVNKILNYKLSASFLNPMSNGRAVAGKYTFVFEGGVLTDVWREYAQSVSWIK